MGIRVSTILLYTYNIILNGQIGNIVIFKFKFKFYI